MKTQVMKQRRKQIIKNIIIMKNHFGILLLSLLSAMMVSCTEGKVQESKDFEYDYLAVKLVGSERWSILDVRTGEVLYKDEFKEAPTAVGNDVFVVKNGNETYDYYNIKDVKKPINDKPYYMAMDFVNSDIVPACLEDEQITLINNKCDIVATLDTTINFCLRFVEGFAPFMNSYKKLGFIDKAGRIVIDAKYDNVKYFHNGISVCWTKNETDDLTTYFVIDKTGKELFSFNSEEYVLAGDFSEGYLPVLKDDEIIYLDKTGKKVRSLCSLTDEIDYDMKNALYNLNSFACINGRSIFCEGETFGLKDRNNNIILRAKYDLLVNSGYEDGRYLAKKEDKCGVIDFNDNIVLDFKYDDIFQLRKDVFIVGNGQTKTLINDKGQDVTKVNFTEYSVGQVIVVKSDYQSPADMGECDMVEDSLGLDTCIYYDEVVDTLGDY